MLSRPKPGESEEDLLKFQSQFLAAGTSSAVKVVKKADKRKGEKDASQETGATADGRDVVQMQDYPDLPPILTPGPSKKSKASGTRVHFAEEDPEDLFEKHDHHITAVISKIIERDTSNATITAPAPTGEAFPRVFHRSEIPSVTMPGPGKISIFAQKMAAKRVAEAAKRAESISMHPDSPMPPPIESRPSNLKGEIDVKDVPCIISGEGLQNSSGHQEAQRIHEENVEKLKALTKEEILQEQERLLSQLDPKLVTFLRSKRQNAAPQEDSMNSEPADEAQTVSLESPGSPAQTASSETIPFVISQAKEGEFASVLKGSVLRLLLDAGFLFLLRFSIDDSADNVIASSIAALHALLVAQS